MIQHTRLFTLTSLIIIGLSLSACETVEGAGRDIENTGESIQRSAN